MKIPTREEAFDLLERYTENDGLIKHALSVEAVMRRFARLAGEDEEKWGTIGLIHDLDYDKHPEEHCKITEKILREEDWPEEYIHAVMSHGWGICTEVEPVEYMEKVLFTIDELTGLVTTTVLVRPSRSVLDTQVISVKKKWKEKRFAAGVDRSIIEKGAEMIGMELSEVIAQTINGMREVADQIGLRGDVTASKS